MYYPQNQAASLPDELFRNPTAEYRAVPFWAWNDELDPQELCRQIDEFREMGFGGFCMHSRSGLKTPYLGKEFMDCITACEKKAAECDMGAWLYDEDRYPSGCAGGIVTKDKRYRQRELRFSTDAAYATLPTEDPGNGDDFLIATFDIELNRDGSLKSYPMVDPEAPVKGTRWYAICYSMRPSGWYNGQSYVDTMNPEAIRKFLDSTYELYYKENGDAFGKSIPCMFTDEPRVYRSKPLANSHSKEDFSLAWTADFPETFFNCHGFDIRPHLPELVWALPDNAPSRARYLYHEHRSTRFIEAYMAQISKWCKEHGIAFTGHMPGENTLDSHIESVGDIMRAYGYFDIPGMDLLMDLRLLNMAKQCQSAVHQYGKEAMISELYGVTGWEFDFRHHKIQGDWQAALGVSLRVPHLSWYSMRGSGKRDYPASIHYQSSWYRQYPYLEDHYARINTAMTRGKPIVNIAVVHPTESNWLNFAAADMTGDKRGNLQNDFETVYQWMLSSNLDYDYVFESTLPELWKDSDEATLNVGQMSYQTVLVAGCETLRSSTVSILTAYQSKGGNVIFMGEPPHYVDAVVPEPNSALEQLIAKSQCIPFSKPSLLKALEDQREIGIRLTTGLRGEDWVYQLRQDGDRRWLFLGCAVPMPGGGKKGTHPELDGKEILLTIRGRWKPTLYNTLNGTISEIPYTIDGPETLIRAHLYCHDSMLLRLDPAAPEDTGSEQGLALLPSGVKPACYLDWKTDVSVKRSEDNVLLLDLAEWSEDGETFFPLDEIRRIDKKLRKKYGFPDASGRDVQPWALPKEKIDQFVYLRFQIKTEICVSPRLAYEAIEEAWLDGKRIDLCPNGWFTDRHIIVSPIPQLTEGRHELIVKIPFTARESLENLFLLGDFDVQLRGFHSCLTKPSTEYYFGDLVHQGMPFYGADVTYTLPFEIDQDEHLVLQIPKYSGAVLSVTMDGNDLGNLAFAPYRLDLGTVPAGKHTITVTDHLTRHNSFASMHNTSGDIYKAGKYWYPKEHSFCFEYLLLPNGLLLSPRLEVYHV